MKFILTDAPKSIDGGIYAHELWGLESSTDGKILTLLHDGKVKQIRVVETDAWIFKLTPGYVMAIDGAAGLMDFFVSIRPPTDQIVLAVRQMWDFVEGVEPSRTIGGSNPPERPRGRPPPND